MYQAKEEKGTNGACKVKRCIWDMREKRKEIRVVGYERNLVSGTIKLGILLIMIVMRKEREEWDRKERTHRRQEYDS